MGKKDTIGNIKNYVDAYFPLLYLYTTEELKTMEMIKEVFDETDEAKDMFTFDIADGLTWYEGKTPYSETYQQHLEANRRKTLENALTYIMQHVKSSFIVFKDMHHFFQSGPHLTRIFKNFLNENIERDRKRIIPAPRTRNYFFILSSVSLIPPELEKDIVLIDIPLPTKQEIEHILNAKRQNIGEILSYRLIEALSGLTETEINNVLDYCCVEDGKLDENDIETIVFQKQQLIRKGGTLDFINVREKMDDIGGLENLKEWINKKNKIFEKYEKALKHGVDVPKGVLFYGMPGCGKSMAAKAISVKFNMPLLRLDMGMILGPYVGQSEENIRKAIKLAESIAPSVLWIDEMEKVFAGVGDVQGNGGSATSTRIFGTFLTWMQEKIKPVFVVATANDIAGMPPEFMRRGRFDEVFFIDFPKKQEIEEIFKKHLEKRLRKLLNKEGEDVAIKNNKENTEKIIKNIKFDQIWNKIKDDEYSGADIEAIVKEIIEDAFISDKCEITTETFMNKIKDFNPSSKSMAKRIKEIREKAKEYKSKLASK